MGGMSGMPNLGGLGGLGGMGGMPNVDPSQLNAMMSNPLYMNMMSDVIIILLYLIHNFIILSICLFDKFYNLDVK